MSDTVTLAELARSAPQLPQGQEEETELDPLRNLLIGIGAGDCHQLFVASEITHDMVPYLTKSDLVEIGVDKDQIELIYEGILCLRPMELNDMNKKEKELFDEFSLRLSEKETLELAENCASQIAYLAGVVQHIKRNVRGFEGRPGCIENLENVYTKHPGNILNHQIDQITATIDSLVKT